MLGSLSKGKTREYRELFRAYPEIDFKALGEIVWNPTSFQTVENANTYYDNAYAKGQLAHYAAKLPTIADDSGLEVDALGGRPGVRAHRFAEPKRGEAQDFANNRKLLEELKGLPGENRGARFACTIVFFVEGVVLSATGTLEGTILEAPRGDQGFGYDPLFLPKGSDKTLAEMSTEDKNKISHRARALKALMMQIRDKKIELVRP
ncbi:MAG: RdgB/HAM1 family non-canonical purine NTP pyrophosphatase [Deltaproteobacteria bacterium]|nr:RdgB/HAM1 family non-canonical purine NTP pyrophosphatase [Deltaproteobacteria bacterium]